MEFEKDKPTFFARIKPFLMFVGFVVAVCGGIYASVVFRTPVADKITAIPQLSFLKELPVVPDSVFEFDLLVFLNEGLEDLKASIARKVTGKEPLITQSQTKKNQKSKAKPKSKPKKQEERVVDPAKLVTLYLKNGKSITGELIGSSDRAYVLWWEGGQVAFNVSEVERIERKANDHSSG